MGDSDSIQNDDSIGAVTKSEKQHTHTDTHRDANVHMPKKLWAD